MIAGLIERPKKNSKAGKLGRGNDTQFFFSQILNQYLDQKKKVLNQYIYIYNKLTRRLRQRDYVHFNGQLGMQWKHACTYMNTDMQLPID